MIGADYIRKRAAASAACYHHRFMKPSTSEFVQVRGAALNPLAAAGVRSARSKLFMLHGVDGTCRPRFQFQWTHCADWRDRAGLARLRVGANGRRATVLGSRLFSPIWTGCSSTSSRILRPRSSATAMGGKRRRDVRRHPPRGAWRSFVTWKVLGSPHARGKGAERYARLAGPRLAEKPAFATTENFEPARRAPCAATIPALSGEKAAFLARHWGKSKQTAASSSRAIPSTNSSTRFLYRVGRPKLLAHGRSAVL